MVFVWRPRKYAATRDCSLTWIKFSREKELSFCKFSAPEVSEEKFSSAEAAWRQLSRKGVFSLFSLESLRFLEESFLMRNHLEIVCQAKGIPIVQFCESLKLLKKFYSEETAGRKLPRKRRAPAVARCVASAKNTPPLASKKFSFVPSTCPSSAFPKNG